MAARCTSIAVILMGLAVGAAPASAQVQQAVVKTSTPLRGKVAGGVVVVGKDRVVVGFHHDVEQRGSSKVDFVLDRATLETVAELPNGGVPEQLIVFPEAVITSTYGYQFGTLWGLGTGDRRYDFEKNSMVHHEPDQLYSAWTGAIIKRHDPASGRVLWERSLGAGFEPEIGLISCLRDGVWVSTSDRRVWQFLRQDGKPGARHEVGATELPPRTFFGAAPLDLGDEDGLVLSAAGLPAGKGKTGALFRLLVGGKAKDLLLPGGRSGLLLVGRGPRDEAPWTFERKGKRLVVATGRADGGEGEADSYLLVDSRRWKAAGSVRMPADGATTSDQGYLLANGEVVDVSTGKVTANVPADAAWSTLTDGHAVVWDQASTTLRCTPLAGGAPRAIELGGEATFFPLRHGELLLALLRREGSLTSKVIDVATGKVGEGAAHARQVTLLGAVDRPVDGRVWFLVTEAGDPPRVHIVAAPVP